MNYLLIPGNPPAVYFYELWAREIREKNPEARVQVSAYPHLESGLDSKLAFDQVLDAHLLHVRDTFQKTQEKVTVIGHSLGGYFALKVLEKVPELIRDVILVHPFLREPSPLGQQILKAATWFSDHESSQSFLIRGRRFLQIFAPDLTFVTEAEIRQSFRIAKHEKNLIGRDQTPLSIAMELRPRIQVFYTSNDFWCPEHLVQQLKSEVNTIWCAEPHGFVVSKKHRSSLFNKIKMVNSWPGIGGRTSS